MKKKVKYTGTYEIVLEVDVEDLRSLDIMPTLENIEDKTNGKIIRMDYSMLQFCGSLIGD